MLLLEQLPLVSPSSSGGNNAGPWMNALNPCNTSHSFGCNLQNTAQKQALRCSCPCKRPVSICQLLSLYNDSLAQAQHTMSLQQTRQRRHAAVQASSAIHENIPAELTKIVAGFQMVSQKWSMLLLTNFVDQLCGTRNACAVGDVTCAAGARSKSQVSAAAVLCKEAETNGSCFAYR